MNFPEKFRWKDAPHGYSSSEGDPFGCFQIPRSEAAGRALNVIAVDGEETGWEHVSVAVFQKPFETPTWKEMCKVKAIFWNDDECVVQFHPPESDYVNQHKGCLHLWRSTATPFPQPPTICV